jgi:hypothetical protein
MAQPQPKSSPLSELCSALPSLPARLQQSGALSPPMITTPPRVRCAIWPAEAGADPASFTRLAKALGYSGWDELRAALTEARRPVLAQPFSARTRGGRKGPHADISLGRRQAGSRGGRPCAHFHRLGAEAAKALHAARRIWIAGFRSCRSVAELLNYQLRLFRSDEVQLVGGSGPEISTSAPSGAAMRSWSSALRPIPGPACCRRARRMIPATTLIAIADAITAPMAEGADHLLLYEAAASPGILPSLTAPLRLRSRWPRSLSCSAARAQSGRLEATERPAGCNVAICCRERLIVMGANRSRVLHRNLRETPPKAIGGEGVWLIGEDGRRILDASGGAAVSCLGHQHPRVLEAMARQASKLAYAHTSFFSSEPAEALADKLVGHEPGGLAYAYFVSGGSEAIEAGIKLARQYFIETGQPQRQRFIARRQSYHGNTLGALAAGGNAWRREPYGPLLSSAFSHVTPAFAYHEKRDSESEADFVSRLAAELERNSSVLARRTWRRSSPSRLWARPPAACRRRRDISAPSARSATGTARSSSSTR